MKKFLCYDTNDVANGKIDVDSRGVLKSAGSSVQPDWNVTDSADPAFIKNKPFGVEKGAAIRSVSGLSWSENTTGIYKEDYPYKADVTAKFESFEEVPNEVQLVIDDVLYANINIQRRSMSMGYEYYLSGENCPVMIQSLYGYTVDNAVYIYSKTQDVTSVKVIDPNGEGGIVKKIDAQYLYQADWNENNSSSPAYILNKPESLGGGVTWFSGSGDDSGFSVRRGKNYENGVSVTGTEIINAFESGVCRFNVTIVSCCDNYNTNGTMTCYYVNNDSIKCYVTGCYGDAISSTRTLVSESIAL